MVLVTDSYLVTKRFPKDEQFGLTPQLRRCAISVPSNIAEGFERASNKDYHRFLKISLGSLFEFQTQIEIANNLKYFNDTEFNTIYERSRELERMLTSIIDKVKKTL